MITRARAIRLTGTLLAVLAFVFFGRTLYVYWQQASSALVDRNAILGGCGALGLGLLGYVFSALGWTWICRALDMPIRTSTALGIYFVSQFGKYLPGNIAQHAGRLAMSVQRRLPAASVAASQVIEVALVLGMLGGLALAAGSRYLGMLTVAPHLQTKYVLVGVLALLAVALLTIRLIAHSQRLQKLRTLLWQCLWSRRHFTYLAVATGAILLNALLASLAVYLIISSISKGRPVSFFGAIGIYAASWVTGFVTPGAPAGLGVRDAVMYTLLSSTMPSPEAAAVSLMFRIITTLADLLIFVTGLGIHRTRSEGPGGTAPAPFGG